MIRLLLLLLILGLAATLAAQDGLRFLSATTYTDPATGNRHAYLVWQAENPEHLRNLRFEVFAKPGQPTSAASFTLRGRMELQTSTAVISALLDSTPDILVQGDLLEERIDSLFGSLLPGGQLTLAMKISGILQVAQSDPEVHRRLVFFSRTHPFLGLVMGTAGSYPAGSAVTTFELRRSDGDATVVEGRVTLDANNPPAIPAPGAPVHVVDESPSGHLNVKIRWGIPPNLARRTALTYGYNLYRVDRAFAESQGFHSSPPGPAAITTLLTSQPDEVAIVNTVPVMPTASLSVADAADLAADPDTAFITDDNGVILDGGSPFSDGDQFYYYVAARDLLGRPGTLSNGTLITLCDRQRTEPPVRTRVRHVHLPGAARTDFLEVSWEAPADEDVPDFYYVYRWENPEQMLAAAAATPFNPATGLISGAIPHNPATRRYTFCDDGPGSPALVPGSYRSTGDDGKTYWYSVRAVKSTACGPLVSGNSAPGWGVLRDRLGPDATGASSVVAKRSQPDLILRQMSTRSLAVNETADSYLGNGDRFVRATITRIDPRIQASALYYYFISGNDVELVPVARKTYSAGDDVLEVRVKVTTGFFNLDGQGIIAAARDARGRTTYKALAGLEAPNPDNNRVCEIPFDADVVDQTSTVSGGGIGDDPVHNSVDEGSGGTNPVEVNFFPTDDAREYKLYKRIDGAPLLLVDQGAIDDSETEITIEDLALPANSSQVCYFVQYFDEHGNPSPLADLGCVRTTAKVEMPVPILSRPEAAGTSANPRVTLRWFCETEGVERFRIYIDGGDSPVDVNYSNELDRVFLRVPTAPPTSPLGLGFPEPGGGSFEGTAQEFNAWETGRIGGNFGDPATPNQFEMTLNVAPGREYRFYVVSISPAGDLSAPSNIGEFLWSPQTPPSGNLVPWPARSLPAVDDAFIPDAKARYLLNPSEDRHYAVVKIGEITGANPDVGVQPGNSGSENNIPFRSPPSFSDSLEMRFYVSNGGENAMPFVLYRTQVASTWFPEVPGDVVQVSPTIDRVRTQPVTLGGGQIIHQVLDPFIELLWDNEDNHYGIFVKDTQGVVRGATYQYTLVRFRDDGEIDRAFPLNELSIPLVDP